VVYGYGTDTGYAPKAGLEHELKSLNLMFSRAGHHQAHGAEHRVLYRDERPARHARAGKLADIVLVGGNPLDGYWNLLIRSW